MKRILLITALVRRESKAGFRILSGAFALLLVAAIANAQNPSFPLKPPDRSNPRAALRTFLESGDAIGAFISNEYAPSPSREKFHRLTQLAEASVECLDLSQTPPASRVKIGRAAAIALYVTLSRIQLPAFEQIPNDGAAIKPAGSNPARWVIPNTEIAFERVQTGPRADEFLISADTVARAEDFYGRAMNQPYARPVPMKNLRELMATGGGWLIPYRWVSAMPPWMKAPLGKQAAWKWMGLALVLAMFFLFLSVAFRISRRGSPERPFLRALAQFMLPAYFLAAVPIVAYVALVQFNMSGAVGGAIEMAASGVWFLASAWISWRAAPVFAEAILASPRIAPESIDAHFIHTGSRLLGIIAGAIFLAMGADRLGLPVYGIIAGLGVGGLAIALAAQSTIENLIGGLTLFADKPIRVGDLCQYRTEIGTVETIGIRSTRIRGLDRRITTVPNAELSKIPVVNFSERDRMLIQTVIGVRYETSSDQLRYLLTQIREMLIGHPRILAEPLRVRFINFGASSLEIEIFAYVTTRVRAEFHAIREDVLLRIMDILEKSGTGLAYPSQTLYLARDGGLDAGRTEAAQEQVSQWRREGRLPFPDFPPEEAQRMRGTFAYPPQGAPGNAFPEKKDTQ